MTMRSYVLTNVLLVNRFGYKHLLHALNVILHIHLKRTDDSDWMQNQKWKQPMWCGLQRWTHFPENPHSKGLLIYKLNVLILSPLFHHSPPASLWWCVRLWLFGVGTPADLAVAVARQLRDEAHVVFPDLDHLLTDVVLGAARGGRTRPPAGETHYRFRLFYIKFSFLD